MGRTKIKGQFRTNSQSDLKRILHHLCKNSEDKHKLNQIDRLKMWLQITILILLYIKSKM